MDVIGLYLLITIQYLNQITISSLINPEYSINVPLITYYDEPKKIWFYKGFSINLEALQEHIL